MKLKAREVSAHGLGRDPEEIGDVMTAHAEVELGPRQAALTEARRKAQEEGREPFLGTAVGEQQNASCSEAISLPPGAVTPRLSNSGAKAKARIKLCASAYKRRAKRRAVPCQ